MIIHFSILGLILLVSLISESRIRTPKLNAISRGESYDFKSELMPWVLVFGYVAYLAAMRSGMNDTSVYILSFAKQPGNWMAITDKLASSGKDKAFDITANLFKMFVSDNFHMWFALFAVVESCLFVSVLRREAVSFLDACFVFFATTLYYNYFSMMRQWMAVVIVFWGSRFIKENKFLPYLILCLFAAQFHNSAYLFIPVFFIVNGEAWSTKQLVIILGFAAAMSVLSPILNRLQTAMEGTTYDYVVDVMMSNSGSSIIRPVIAAVPVGLAFIYRRFIPKEHRMINVSVNMSMINLMLNILATFTSGLYVVRLATYAATYNLILYPYLLNVAVPAKNRNAIKMAFYVLFLLFFYFQMNQQRAWAYISDVLGTYYYFTRVSLW